MAAWELDTAHASWYTGMRRFSRSPDAEHEICYISRVASLYSHVPSLLAWNSQRHFRRVHTYRQP